jgi:hypothetical protein
MKKTLLTTACLLGIVACSEQPAGVYYNRGDPENLLDVTSETVNMSLTSISAITDLRAVLAKDTPTSAEVNCSVTETKCMQAKELLETHGVPIHTGGNTGGLTLMYDRVEARDCQNRFIDNTINPYNLHPPTFGCSVTANTVQMVSDKREFTSPNLLDFQDGEKAVQMHRRYLKPPPEKSDDTGSMSSPLITTGTSGGSR